MKRILILAVVLFIIGLGNVIHGQKMTAMRDSVTGGYNFWVYDPEVSDQGLKPLVIFLHGASLKGNDMRKVLKYGPLNAINRGIKVNAYVVAPQTSGNWEADKIWKCVEWVKEHYPIDSNRISVVGMSLGGFGTFTLATKYYNKLSAGMMLCGGNTNDDYYGLTKMPFWIMHGTADKAVPISRSNSIVSNMAAYGDTSRLLYTKLQGADHGYPAKLFYLTETYDWLTSHSLTDTNRAVNRKINISQEMISRAYGRLTGEQGAVEVVTAPVKPRNETENNVKAAENVQSDMGNTATSDTATHKAATSDTVKTVDTQNSKKNSEVQYHIVRKGNTLSQIAEKYHTTVARLCKLNGISEDAFLQVGQKLKVRGTPTNGSQAKANAGQGTGKTSGTTEKAQKNVQDKANPDYHTVVSGNTLYSIAQKYHTTVEILCELNGINENVTLQVGQKIKLPKHK